MLLNAMKLQTAYIATVVCVRVSNIELQGENVKTTCLKRCRDKYWTEKSYSSSRVAKPLQHEQKFMVT